MLNLRPTNFSEFIGQEQTKKNLDIFIKSSIKQKKALDHIMIHGPSGLGKTSLAHIVGKQLNKKLFYLNGTSLQKPSDIISPLTKIKENEIIFIDEIHAINRDVIETLYPVLEDNFLSIIIGKDYNSKAINIKIPKFTLIGATTEINKIPEPFLNRFPIIFYLTNYTNDEIEKIVKNSCKKIAMNIEDEAILKISTYCKQNPRIANNLIQRVYDFYIMKDLNIIAKKDINNILYELGIFKYGLSTIELDYLKILENKKSISINTISQILNIPTKTLEINVEPILIKLNFIEKSTIGRKITSAGIEYIANC
ncbi:Holliday junction branch migration DNA helicase RuvB [Spiroplasma endosymbiont of Aspidapion aeneum]|uniref:Holliday junction branch migration DNA helicase RuvB n=1 Tax=Spiroplasma endosymbiont of Aspidapion aeneum TaxID=3066276 RepID=UPI00313AE7B6